jgi:hypothetical protein
MIPDDATLRVLWMIAFKDVVWSGEYWVTPSGMVVTWEVAKLVAAGFAVITAQGGKPIVRVV